jgi:hypothetical protein
MPKSREWLIVNYVVNAVGITLSGLYIFRGERICDDYIQLCKPRTCMAMQSKAWMITFLFNEFLSFSKRSIPSGISITNIPMLILDGHGSHLTLEAIEQVQKFGLDMIILPSHTFHALQPLDVVCFKPFKTPFRKEKNIAMVRKNYTKLNKITLARWVDKTLDLTLIRHNIMSWFKSTWIRPFNPKAMDSKTSSNILHTLQNQARAGGW